VSPGDGGRRSAGGSAVQLQRVADMDVDARCCRVEQRDARRNYRRNNVQQRREQRDVMVLLCEPWIQTTRTQQPTGPIGNDVCSSVITHKNKCKILWNVK